MAWKIEYAKEAENDLRLLDHSQILLVLKAILKISDNPLPKHEGGYGKPLSNTSSLKTCWIQ